MSNSLPAPKAKPDNERVYQSRVRPLKWHNPKPKSIYDLAIIGAGPAGIAAAELAVQYGARVALVERDRIGGNSLNSGSVPSKAIIKSAGVYANIRKAEEFGAPMSSEPLIDFAKVQERMREIRSRISEHHSVEKLTKLGVDVFFSDARFNNGEELEAGCERLLFGKALIATGARPRPPNIPGLSQTGYCTSDTIFERSGLPRRLAVIGGGPLGCEMAQAFCRLGSRVTIVQKDPKFLPREERDAAEILSRSMARDGVEIRLNTAVVGAHRANGARVLETVSNDVQSEIETDDILLSIGRVPNIEELGLENAGIAISGERGIQVDDFLQTTNARVYAAGDVCMALKFTNAAKASAYIAVRNAMRAAQERHDQLIIPWCTYCDPEIAHIGLHAFEAKRQSIPIKSYSVMMHDIDRAIIDSSGAGFVKIHVEEGTDRILGATIVASRASELINEMSVVLTAKIGMKQLSEIIHAYPAESGAIASIAQMAVFQAAHKSPHASN